MWRARELTSHPSHDPASAQDWEVERSAVESGQRRRLIELLAKRMQERRLHPGLGQEELRDAKAAVDWSRDRRRKDVSPCTAGESSCFGVDIGDVPWVRIQRWQWDDVFADGRHTKRGVRLRKAPRQPISRLRSRPGDSS